MNEQRFDAFARQVSRRSALRGLSVTALAAGGGLALADAASGKSNKQQQKKKRKKKQEKLQKRIEEESLALCAGQVPQCLPLLNAECDSDDVECLAFGERCCGFLATCDFAAAAACLLGPPIV